MAIALGVLVPFAVMLLASGLSEMLYKRTVLFVHFIGGFITAFVFGGRRYRVLLLAIAAYMIFLVAFVISTTRLGIPEHTPDLGILLFAAIFPPFSFIQWELLPAEVFAGGSPRRRLDAWTRRRYEEGSGIRRGS